MAKSHGLVITGVIALGLVAMVASKQDPADAAQTAALLITPATGNQTVGSTFDVDVKLTTGGQAVAGAEVRITLSSNLQYVSFSSGGSVFSQDVINPQVSGNQITFSRVRFDDGYNGSNGQVLKLTLKGTAAGQGTIAIDQANTDVLDYANAADILQTVSSATVTLGTPPGPEVDVTEGSNHVSNNGKVTLGTIKGTSAAKTFTVKNLGQGALEIESLTVIPSAGLTITTPLAAATLAQNGTATFAVSITGEATGTKSYTLSFPTNDSDENPFSFTLETSVSATSTCGDGVCARKESCTSCAADCGVCASSSSAAAVSSQAASSVASDHTAAGIPAALCDEARAILTFSAPSGSLTLPVDGVNVTFNDVPGKEWFTKYVKFALNGKIASGYRDAQGRLTGQFGPGNNVTHGEIAKMLLLSQGLGEANGSPRNISARGQWFERFFTAAENAGWRLHASGTLNGNAPATRGEVTSAIVDAFGLQTKPKSLSFKDLPDSHPYAADINTLTGYGVMAGDPTGTVRPDSPINRAEFSKLISVATNVGCR